MSDAILSLNAGSSSLKFALYRIAEGRPAPLARGQIEGIGAAPHLIVRDSEGQVLTEQRWPDGRALTHEAFFTTLFDWIETHLGDGALVAVGHRVVHGGTDFSGPVRVTPEVLARLSALEPLAPLHQPHNLAAIRAAQAVRPGLPQVAAFDTAFHRTLPPVAWRLALTRELEAQGVRRYGFHGLSYAYIAKRLAEIDPGLAGGRVIAAHLGAGASLCAMRSGVSVDTTMGFTAVDGLVMGTRCGALDPGVVLHLVQTLGWSAQAIEDLIYRRSGLLGVSGLSADMRTLLASDDPKAKDALDLFVYSIARHAGALASALGGLDGLIFTAGIGENSPEIRARVCERLSWLGVELDPVANAAAAPVVSTPSSRVVVRVIPTDEEQMIALEVVKVLGSSS